MALRDQSSSRPMPAPAFTASLRLWRRFVTPAWTESSCLPSREADYDGDLSPAVGRPLVQALHQPDVIPRPIGRGLCSTQASTRRAPEVSETARCYAGRTYEQC